jgi:hypothetical protein
MKNTLIFVVAAVIFNSIFAAYFYWLHNEPKPDAGQVQAVQPSKPHEPSKLEARQVTEAPYKSWIQLTPMQQEALNPLAAQWGSLPAKLQNNLLLTTKHYTRLTQDQKQRFHSRLEKWSKLTPEQRERARNKYKVISKAPPDKREQLKRMAREREANKTSTTDSDMIGQK